MQIKRYSGWLLENLTPTVEKTIEKSLAKRVNFPSGFHSAAASKLNTILTQPLAEIKDFLVKNKGSIIEIQLKAGESQVPNFDAEVTPKKKLAPGELSKKRYSTIKNYMTTWLTDLQKGGIIADVPGFAEDAEPVIGATPWNPPAGATPAQIKALAAEDQYRAEQYLEVSLKVVASQIEMETQFSQLAQRTNRSANAGLSDFNASIFYNYSVAPAAVLGRDPKSLPGALLTMSRLFQAQIPMQIGNVTVDPIKVTITPNGGEIVKLVCLPGTVKTSSRMLALDNTQQGVPWTEWYAAVAPSYNLTVNFKEGTPQFKYAWMFVYWYIKTSFPSDWNFIANKPAGIKFDQLNSMQAISNFKTGSTLETQQYLWNTPYNGVPMKDWYAAQVKEWYS